VFEVWRDFFGGGFFCRKVFLCLFFAWWLGRFFYVVFFYALRFYGGFYVARFFFLMRYFCFFMRLILMSRVDSVIAYGYLIFYAWPQDTTSWTVWGLSLCHFGGCHYTAKNTGARLIILCSG
jgi:hypothetical protein